MGRCAWFLVLYVSAGDFHASVMGTLPTEPSRQPTQFLSMVHYSLIVQMGHMLSIHASEDGHLDCFHLHIVAQ